jgi:hypothetical protein
MNADEVIEIAGLALAVVEGSDGGVAKLGDVRVKGRFGRGLRCLLAKEPRVHITLPSGEVNTEKCGRAST